ncbi:MAG TPA: S53 family peptidase, partial [Candidatus Binatia bacterium]|nr:S53 family peptidase [Candidatus Binatia bacterium]
MAHLCALAQNATEEMIAAPAPLITGTIDESQLTTLQGNTHPLARAEFDLGTAPASLPMQRMLLVLKRSPQQESTLAKLLDDQQDKNSPNYHKWVSPEQFGKQFGPTDNDMQVITSWLQSHGFEVGATKGRGVLEFSGSASQVRETFHTTIHKYLVNGEQHWANASDPQIPSALTPAVAGVASLNDFRPRAMNSPAGAFSRDPVTGKITAVHSEFTFPAGCVENDKVQGACYYALGPYDFATIYDVLPLWNAGINGTGETIAIVGESNINVQDVANFRSLFGLPVNNPTVILNGPDPGLAPDESEADIDVQWSGAVAPNATIDFVVSQSTESTAGVDLSAVYIVENNLAPVMSESYGYCELGLGASGNQFYSNLWQQAAAEGITVFVSSGDNGSAGCDNINTNPPAPAQYGLKVSGFASTPYNVAVGGTDFNDFSNPATYWSISNNSTTQASALSYIPETTWNDSCTNAIFGTVGFSTNAETNCNDSRLVNFVVPEGGSGGVSNCTTPSGLTPASCAGGYAKPSWQSGTGVPADGKRDIPDVSLFASNGFMGSFYIICQSDQTYGTCNLNSTSYFLGFGGTSVSSPAFAGILALGNQQTGSRQGNANY